MDIKTILCDICSACGVSGYEQQAAQRCAAHLSQYAADVRTDALGNVTGLRRCGREGAPLLLFDAHIDEVGMFVTAVTDEGFLRFLARGLDPRTLLSCEVQVLADPPIFGVVACLPPHLQGEDARNKSVPTKDMAIDIGLSAERARALVPVGTPVVFSAKFAELGEDTLSGKSLDDRAGFVSILYALHLLRDREIGCDIAVLGSVQEETGARGAGPGVFPIRPDAAVVIDVTHGKTTDGPADKTFECGGGPPIGMGPFLNRRLTGLMIEIAKKNDIKYQLEVMEEHTGTNNESINVSRQGIPTAMASVPLKYMHTPFETLRLEDIRMTGRLLAEFAAAYGEVDHNA